MEQSRWKKRCMEFIVGWLRISILLEAIAKYYFKILFTDIHVGKICPKARLANTARLGYLLYRAFDIAGVPCPGQKCHSNVGRDLCRDLNCAVCHPGCSVNWTMCRPMVSIGSDSIGCKAEFRMLLRNEYYFSCIHRYRSGA